MFSKPTQRFEGPWGRRPHTEGVGDRPKIPPAVGGFKMFQAHEMAERPSRDRVIHAYYTCFSLAVKTGKRRYDIILYIYAHSFIYMLYICLSHIV